MSTNSTTERKKFAEAADNQPNLDSSNPNNDGRNIGTIAVGNNECDRKIRKVFIAGTLVGFTLP